MDTVQLLNLQNLVILVAFSEQNVLKLLFTQSKKNEAQMRQQTIFKKKDGCQFASTNSFVSANEKAPSHGAGLTKQIYK